MTADLKSEFPKAVIIWGRQGSGMTRNAQLLAALYGKDTVCEFDQGNDEHAYPDNYLVLTNNEDAEGAISFEDAMRRAKRVHLIAPEAMPHFCRDCKHVRIFGELSTCSAPEVQTVSLVTGPANGRCEKEHAPNGQCGIEARLFEAKEPTSRVRWKSTQRPDLATAILEAKRTQADVLQAQAALMAGHAQPDTRQSQPEAGSLNKFQEVSLRCTTPVDATSLQIGLAFDRQDGEVLRIRLPASDATALSESIQEYLEAHRSRVHSLQSPGIPSVDVSTPEDGVKVYPPLMSSTACSGDM